MKEWALEHPFLTTFLFLVIVAAIESGVGEWARAFAIRNRKGRE